MPSKWLDWKRDRFRHKPDTPDYVIDDDGTFYCEHGDGACANLGEHDERNAANPRPNIPDYHADPQRSRPR